MECIIFMIFIEQFRARWPWSIGVLESWLPMSSSSEVSASSILRMPSPRRFVPGCGRHLQEWSLYVCSLQWLFSNYKAPSNAILQQPIQSILALRGCSATDTSNPTFISLIFSFIIFCNTYIDEGWYKVCPQIKFPTRPTASKPFIALRDYVYVLE